jgi:hypothetical protein
LLSSRKGSRPPVRDHDPQHAHQRRGFALLASGMWVLYGLVVITVHDELIVSPDFLPDWLATPDLTGLYYVLLGSIAFGLAAYSKRKKGREGAAYRLLILIPGMMAALLIPSAISGHAPGGVVMGSLFIMLSLTSYYISGWRPLLLVKEAGCERVL